MLIIYPSPVCLLGPKRRGLFTGPTFPPEASLASPVYLWTKTHVLGLWEETEISGEKPTHTRGEHAKSTRKKLLTHGGLEHLLEAGRCLLHWIMVSEKKKNYFVWDVSTVFQKTKKKEFFFIKVFQKKRYTCVLFSIPKYLLSLKEVLLFMKCYYSIFQKWPILNKTMYLVWKKFLEEGMLRGLDESVWRIRRGLYRCTFTCVSDGERQVQYRCINPSFQKKRWRFFFFLCPHVQQQNRSPVLLFTSCLWQVIIPRHRWGEIR